MRLEWSVAMISQEEFVMIHTLKAGGYSHRAVANAAGFLKYFFRGQMEVEANACGVKVTNISNPSTVSGAGTVAFKSGGVLKVFYDDEAGNREMIDMKTLEADLPVQESVFVPVRFFKKEYDETGDAKGYWLMPSL